MDDDDQGYAMSGAEQQLDFPTEESVEAACARFAAQAAVERNPERLRRINRRWEETIRHELNDVRRRAMRARHAELRVIREAVLRLDNGQTMGTQEVEQQLSGAMDALTSATFDDLNRRIGILFGAVRTLANLFVLDITVHGLAAEMRRHLRKQTVSALTNLSFGHADSKLLLCLHPAFLRTLVDVLQRSFELVKVSAGLVRNLSWHASDEIERALEPTVPPLAAAIVKAHKVKDESCLKAVLAALWNLSAHSTANKQAVCEQPGVLELFAKLMTNDPKRTIIVESVSGITKYACAYLAMVPEAHQMRAILANRLIDLLSSASFGIVCNALSALTSLVASDGNLRNWLLGNGAALQLIQFLRDSRNEECGLACRQLLDTLHEVYPVPAYFEAPRNSSIPSSPMIRSTCFATAPGLLLPLRQQHGTPRIQPPQHVQPNAFDGDDGLDEDGLTTSVRATRAPSTEPTALGDDSVGGNETEQQQHASSYTTGDEDEEALSRASPSSLPDSPTQAGELVARYAQRQKEQQQQQQQSGSEISTVPASGSVSATIARQEDLDDLLQRSIEAARPQKNDDDNDEDDEVSKLLDRSIAAAMPPKAAGGDADKLLADCIADAMPPKNGRTRRRQAAPKKGAAEWRSMNSSEWGALGGERLRDAAQLRTQLVSPSSSSSTSGSNRSSSWEAVFAGNAQTHGDEDRRLPEDLDGLVLDAAPIRVDCRTAAATRERLPSRLPQPRQQQTLSPRHAVVPPNNYKMDSTASMHASMTTSTSAKRATRKQKEQQQRSEEATNATMLVSTV